MVNDGLLKKADGITPPFYHLKTHLKAYNIFNYKHEKIAADILQGISQENMHKIFVELDREESIKKAYSLSQAGTIIALLGKGPDNYQIIGSAKIPFYEAKILTSL